MSKNYTEDLLVGQPAGAMNVKCQKTNVIDTHSEF